VHPSRLLSLISHNSLPNKYHGTWPPHCSGSPLPGLSSSARDLWQAQTCGAQWCTAESWLSHVTGGGIYHISTPGSIFDGSRRPFKTASSGKDTDGVWVEAPVWYSCREMLIRSRSLPTGATRIVAGLATNHIPTTTTIMSTTQTTVYCSTKYSAATHSGGTRIHLFP
jgi:hypothetical protein